MERLDLAGVELRAEGRRLVGDLMPYGDISPSHKERFEPRSLHPAESVTLNLAHDEMRAIAWYPGGGLTLDNDERALRMFAELPPIPAADRALRAVRKGAVNGLSVEFVALRERREQNIRVVEDALLTGAAILKEPSYENAKVEARRRSGFRLRAFVPSKKKVACRCSGAGCKFARFAESALQEAFDEAFDEARKEIIASYGSYAKPLASRSKGTLRRVGQTGVDIDIPENMVDEVISASEDSGIVVRPFLDGDESISTMDRDTAVYSKARIRAFIVNATDEREGWPEPEIITGERAAVRGKEATKRTRLWL